MTNFIQKLGAAISQKNQELEDFFVGNFAQNPALFNNSVDLRHSNFKIAPVDTNCFPAGYNNLSEESKNLAKEISKSYLAKHFPQAEKVLIIPENHTRNLRYFSSLKNLHEILAAHKEVKIGSLNPEVNGLAKFELENGEIIELNSLRVEEQNLQTFDGFKPDLVISNNDFTDGVSPLIQNISQTINPATKMGWHLRTKSHHFEIYNNLAKEVAKILEIDPWLISTIQRKCSDVNFKDQIGLENLAKNVDEVLQEIKSKYQQYGIQEEPYCYVKADNGTYGMAVWSVYSGQEILEINKKERNKMNMLKGSVLNTQVLIQEGVVTVDKINQQISEPMIYLIGGEVVGNLFRSNESRDEKTSLNATGAHFYDLNNLTSEQTELGGSATEIKLVYQLIAKMAALAAAIENQQISTN